jgi:hypothetical protein
VPVFDLANAINGMTQATGGLEKSLSEGANRDYLEALTSRIKSEQLEKENEALRNEKRMAGLQAAAGWSSKWMGRDAPSYERGLNPEALERIAGVARRGPLAFGAAYGQEWSRELSVTLDQKRREAREIAAQMDPRDARAFLADQEAEAQEEVTLAARGAVTKGLARLVANASRIGFDEGLIDAAEQMSELVEAGAMPVEQAEQFLFQSMDAIAGERKRLRSMERATTQIDGIAAEAEDPEWYEELVSDIEAGLLEPDEGYRQAKMHRAGLDGAPLKIQLPGLKDPIESKTELFRGQNRPSGSMPKSARAEATLIAQALAAEHPGFEDLSSEQQAAKVAEKTLLLSEYGGWEIDETDRAMFEGAGQAGGSWDALPPQRQAFARKALLSAVKAGASEEEFREVLEGLGVDPADVPPEMQAEIAEAWKQPEAGGGGPGMLERARGALLGTPPQDVTPAPGPDRKPMPVSGANARMMLEGVQPPAALNRPPDPKKLQELLKALKGGGQ